LQDFDISVDENYKYLFYSNNNFNNKNMIFTENSSIKSGESCIVARWENVKNTL